MNQGTTSYLAGRVRQERLRLGWTQADVAVRAGLSTISYARLERTGRITLDRFVRVAAAIGLSLDLGHSAGAVVVPNPVVLRTRQRGVRHRKPTTAPAAETSSMPADTTRGDPAKPASPASAPIRRGGAAPAAAGSGKVAPADAAAAAKKHREAIRRLVNVIVFNRLTNYTAATVVQNVMRANGVDDGGRAAFVAAVEGELARLNSENAAAFGIDPPHLEAWAQTWQAELGIVGVAE